MSDAERDPRVVPLWRRVMPFLIAIALVAFVFHRIDRRAFLASLERTSFVALIASAAAFTLSLLVTDCVASAYLYRTLVGPIEVKDLLVLRGASYLPGLLNFNVGQAWLTYAISRLCKAPVLRVTSATLLVYVTTFAWIFALGGASLIIDPARFPWLLPAVVVAGGGALVYLAVLIVRPVWFVNWRFTAPLAEAGLRGNLLATLYRGPYVVVLFVGTWLPMRLFGIDIPFVDALALIPPLILLVAVPITPQGVGTRDAFSVSVFAGYAVGASLADRSAAVLAATLSWIVANLIIQVVVSLALVRPAAALTTASERS